MPEKGSKKPRSRRRTGGKVKDDPNFIFTEVRHGTREQENLLHLILKHLEAGHEVEYTERYCNVRKQTFCDGFIRLASQSSNKT